MTAATAEKTHGGDADLAMFLLERCSAGYCDGNSTTADTLAGHHAGAVAARSRVASCCTIHGLTPIAPYSMRGGLAMVTTV